MICFSVELAGLDHSAKDKLEGCQPLLAFC